MASLTVVGAAVIRDGRVLAARRNAPEHLAGRWEFPGGKVEQGESEPQALVRELREELSLQVRVGRVLGRTDLDAGAQLAVYLGDPLGAEPRLGSDHDELRWLAVGDLHTVAWLDADLMFLDALADHLRATP